jgi:hypothetical protein
VPCKGSSSTALPTVKTTALWHVTSCSLVHRYHVWGNLLLTSPWYRISHCYFVILHCIAGMWQETVMGYQVLRHSPGWDNKTSEKPQLVLSCDFDCAM